MITNKCLRVLLSRTKFITHYEELNDVIKYSKNICSPEIILYKEFSNFMFDEKVNFSTHISIVILKGMRMLGFVIRNCEYLPLNTCKLYTFH